MFHLHFLLQNPFRNSDADGKSFFCIDKKISKNKNFSLEFARWPNEWPIFELGLNWSTKRDHAGLEIEIGLFSFSTNINIYDGRHWNYENNRWNNSDDYDYDPDLEPAPVRIQKTLSLDFVVNANGDINFTQNKKR